MTEIFAFRGITYNRNIVKDYSRILTQPYDKIDDKMQAVYYKKHPFNHVRITKGKEMKGDNETNNKYTRAGQCFKNWLKQNILVQDDKPTVYAYYQEYEAEGTKKVRKGFIALGKLVEFGKGGVHPHEQTLLGPKVDRLNQMRAMGGSTGQIFMLYSDPQLKINQLLDSIANKREADIISVDEYDVTHKVWKIQDGGLTGQIQSLMADKDVFIADGHHRYETALNYRNEMLAKGARTTEPESYNNRMMTFVNMDDIKGLTILPTHRIVFGLKKFSFINLEKKLLKYFTVCEYPFFSAADEKLARQDFLRDLKESGKTAHCLGLVGRGINKYIILILRDEKIMDKIIKEQHSQGWKRLDVTILHSLILEKLLGISSDKVAKEENVHYVRGEDKAIEEAKKGKNQLVFLLNPTKANEVHDVAGRGERMPQKSTDFFPKLLSGIVISRVN